MQKALRADYTEKTESNHKFAVGSVYTELLRIRAQDRGLANISYLTRSIGLAREPSGVFRR